MTNVKQQLGALLDAGAEFIVVGGMAASAHGSVRSTFDLDVVYRRTRENAARLVAALASHHPYLRGAPLGLPFVWDATTIMHGLNFTLSTAIGDLDLFGEVVGGGTYEALLPDSIELEPFGLRCRFVTLDRLISLKRAAGRPRDLEAIADSRSSAPWELRP